jgi:hypothetical protein
MNRKKGEHKRKKETMKGWDGGICTRRLKGKHGSRVYGKCFKTIIRTFYYKNFPPIRFYKSHHQHVSVKRFVSLLRTRLARRSNLCSQDYIGCTFWKSLPQEKFRDSTLKYTTIIHRTTWEPGKTPLNKSRGKRLYQESAPDCNVHADKQDQPTTLRKLKQQSWKRITELKVIIQCEIWPKRDFPLLRGIPLPLTKLTRVYLVEKLLSNPIRLPTAFYIKWCNSQNERKNHSLSMAKRKKFFSFKKHDPTGSKKIWAMWRGGVR